MHALRGLEAYCRTPSIYAVAQPVASVGFDYFSVAVCQTSRTLVGGRWGSTGSRNCIPEELGSIQQCVAFNFTGRQSNRPPRSCNGYASRLLAILCHIVTKHITYEEASGIRRSPFS